jgi:hypothetical protein
MIRGIEAEPDGPVTSSWDLIRAPLMGRLKELSLEDCLVA